MNAQNGQMNIAQRILQALRAGFLTFTAAVAQRNAYQNLENLSDKQLARMGMTRGDILRRICLN